MDPSRKPGRRLPEAGRADPKHLPTGPLGRPLCRWCQLEILAPRRRTFCSDFCVHQWKLRSDPGYLRDGVFARDRGICALCSTDTVRAYTHLKRSRGPLRTELLAMWGIASVTARRSLWDADHIVPVAEGGGECDLENLRTLCLPCHREGTADLRRRLRSSLPSAVTLPAVVPSTASPVAAPPATTAPSGTLPLHRPARTKTGGSLRRARSPLASGSGGEMR